MLNTGCSFRQRQQRSIFVKHFVSNHLVLDIKVGAKGNSSEVVHSAPGPAVSVRSRLAGEAFVLLVVRKNVQSACLPLEDIGLERLQDVMTTQPINNIGEPRMDDLLN